MATMRVWTGVPWPVYDVELVTADSTRVASLSVTTSDRERLQTALATAGGVFIRVDDRARKTWNPAAESESEAFYRDALGVNYQDTTKLTGFLNRWGTLGVGFQVPPSHPSAGAVSEAWLAVHGDPTNEAPPAPLAVRALLRHDSLVATQAALAEYQTAVQRLATLRRSPRRDRSQWRAFLDDLEPRLFSIHPTYVWNDARRAPAPAWRVTSLEEALRLHAWSLATAPGQWRRCPRCGGVFTTTDPRKKFCESACARRASAAASYARSKSRARRSSSRSRRNPTTR